MKTAGHSLWPQSLPLTGYCPPSAGGATLWMGLQGTGVEQRQIVSRRHSPAGKGCSACSWTVHCCAPLYSMFTQTAAQPLPPVAQEIAEVLGIVGIAVVRAPGVTCSSGGERQA